MKKLKNSCTTEIAFIAGHALRKAYGKKNTGMVVLRFDGRDNKRVVIAALSKNGDGAERTFVIDVSECKTSLNKVANSSRSQVMNDEFMRQVIRDNRTYLKIARTEQKAAKKKPAVRKGARR